MSHPTADRKQTADEKNKAILPEACALEDSEIEGFSGGTPAAPNTIRTIPLWGVRYHC
jgi:hypothetical protein